MGAWSAETLSVTAEEPTANCARRSALRVSSPVTPAFLYEERAGRYVEKSSGRFVRAEAVRQATDAVIAEGEHEIARLTRRLLATDISLSDWQSEMMQRLRIQHLAQASAAAGGWARVDDAVTGRLEARLEGQFAYLDNFASQIASGAQPLTRAVVTRASLYAQAARGAYEGERNEQMRQAGFDEERNVLGQADSCQGCLEAAEQGWVPIGTLTPVGSRQCLARCHCTLDYRRQPASSEVENE
jgi:hypothetical protein